MSKLFLIGTRPSKLALWQAEHVRALLRDRLGIEAALEKITTRGDKVLDRSLVEIGGKGLFLKEIEDALRAGKIRFAVHSLKDVPYDLPPGLIIAAVLPREDPRDAFVGRNGMRLGDLPPDARVGTTSLRRRVQIQARHPLLKFTDMRGNVDTRLKKLDSGEIDGIVLALAGLKRLGLDARVTEVLDIVPAAGQGAIGIECRADDASSLALAEKLDDRGTARCVAVERSFLRLVEGSCRTPVGCRVESLPGDPSRLRLRYFCAEPDGSNPREGEITAAWDRAEEAVAGIAVPMKGGGA